MGLHATGSDMTAAETPAESAVESVVGCVRGVLAYAHGTPLGQAQYRVTPEDFFVDEVLPFTPDGTGEHLLVQIEKRGNNTAWVAQKLSSFAGVHPRLVSFSGRKDRHAVTRQWFSLQLAGKPDPDWSGFSEAGIRVLATCRHGRKLRTGTHRINRFVLVLRGVDADPAAVAERLALIARAGVPNYFGEQRFGADGSTLSMAQAAVASGRLPQRRERRSLVISALRSDLFNQVLDARVRAGDWNKILPGELVMLEGAGGRCFAEDGALDLGERCTALDIHPSGPLAGLGGVRPVGAALALETHLLDGYDGVMAALARWQVESDRRALRSHVLELAHVWLAPTVLQLSFALWRGAFATMVLREIFLAQDAAVRATGDEPEQQAVSDDSNE